MDRTKAKEDKTYLEIKEVYLVICNKIFLVIIFHNHHHNHHHNHYHLLYNHSLKIII